MMQKNMFAVGVVGMLVGLIDLTIIVWVPFTEVMQQVGTVYSFWLPVFPSVVLGFVGYRLCVQPEPVNTPTRYWSAVTTVATACLCLAVLASFYDMWTSLASARLIALWWALHVLSWICLITLYVELRLWMQKT